MHSLVKYIKNSLKREQIRKDIEDKFAGKSEYWMLSEYDERVNGDWRLSHGNFIVRLTDDRGLEDEVKKSNTMPLHLGASLSSISKRIMNNYIHSIEEFFTNDIHYKDTDSLYLENKHWDKIDNAG